MMPANVFVSHGASHLSLADFVYQHLHAAILNGVFKPGDMLRQEELCRSLGVSRAPLREALPRLEAEGIVRQLPRRGYVVVSLRPEEISELFDLRMLIEVEAVTLGTRARNKHHVQAVRETLNQMSQLNIHDSRDRSAWFGLNARFHEKLILPSNRSHYLKAVTSLRTTVEPYIRVEIGLTGNVNAAIQEHHALADAFEYGDAIKAGELTGMHIKHTATRLLEGLQHRTISASAAL